MERRKPLMVTKVIIFKFIFIFIFILIIALLINQISITKLTGTKEVILVFIFILIKTLIVTGDDIDNVIDNNADKNHLPSNGHSEKQIRIIESILTTLNCEVY